MKKITLLILSVFICAVTFAQTPEVEPNNSRTDSGTFNFSMAPEIGTGNVAGGNPDFWNFPENIIGTLEYTIVLDANPAPLTTVNFITYNLDGSLVSNDTSNLVQGINTFSKAVQSDRLYSFSIARNSGASSIPYNIEVTNFTFDPSLSTNTFELEPSDFIYYSKLKQISVSNKISNVAIYNLLGQNVLNSNHSKISLNTFKTGVYIARIQSLKGTISTRKFIVN